MRQVRRTETGVRGSWTRLLVRRLWVEPALRLNYADAGGNRSRESGCPQIAPKFLRYQSASRSLSLGEIGSRCTCGFIFSHNASQDLAVIDLRREALFQAA
jgi:hypothetical protein